jgi:alkyl sulfatase BDS1-like metallo-beta-lactamase superfamily hydrolase
MTFRTTLRNGVFTYVRDGQGDAALTLTVPRAALAQLAAGDVDAARGAGLILDGDAGALQRLLSVLDPGDPDFNIVEP